VNSGFVEMNRIQSRAFMPHARPPTSPPMRTKAAGACPQTVSNHRAAGVPRSDACLSTLWMAKRVKGTSKPVRCSERPRRLRVGAVESRLPLRKYPRRRESRLHVGRQPSRGTSSETPCAPTVICSLDRPEQPLPLIRGHVLPTVRRVTAARSADERRSAHRPTGVCMITFDMLTAMRGAERSHSSRRRSSSA
jgi:hypothetical protein